MSTFVDKDHQQPLTSSISEWDRINPPAKDQVVPYKNLSEPKDPSILDKASPLDTSSAYVPLTQSCSLPCSSLMEASERPWAALDQSRPSKSVTA